MQIQEHCRLEVRKSLTPSTAQLALQRILPFPCKKQYTAVILMPQTSRFKSLTSLLKFRQTGDAKVSCMLCFAFCILGYHHSPKVWSHKNYSMIIYHMVDYLIEILNSWSQFSMSLSAFTLIDLESASIHHLCNKLVFAGHGRF